MSKPSDDTVERDDPASHKGGHERVPGTRVPPDAPDPEPGATGIGAQPDHEDEMPTGTGNYLGNDPGEPLAGQDDEG